MTTNHKQLILDLLNNIGVKYNVLHHAETPTSEDSARVRCEDLSTGGKALVLKFRKPKRLLQDSPSLS